MQGYLLPCWPIDAGVSAAMLAGPGSGVFATGERNRLAAANVAAELDCLGAGGGEALEEGGRLRAATAGDRNCILGSG